MASQPSFWRKIWTQSWFQSQRPTRRQRKNSRPFSRRALRVECLEGRAMLSGVTVTATPGNALLANASEVVVTGTGFDPIVANNSVQLSDGSETASATVVAATATSLTVAIPPTFNLTGGALDAVATSDNVSSGAPVTVATITPVITSGADNLAANATSITISGYGFDSTMANDAVVFNASGTPITGTVTAATVNSLTVTIPSAPPAGPFTATVTTDSSASSETQVATVTPVVTGTTLNNVAANAASVNISGFGFDGSGTNTVVFNDGAVAGTVTENSATSLTVTFATNPTAAGPLTAQVTTDSVSSGLPAQVATITPVVTATTTNGLAANATTVTINGFGFDTTVGNDTVTFTDGAGTAAGTVTAATPTSLTVTFSTDPTIAGSLTAVVSVDSLTSGAAAQVATVDPVVTASTASLAVNATSITFFGFGFDTTLAHDAVVFNAGGTPLTGTVTGATLNSLTVTIPSDPPVGSLTATVTTNSAAGTETQVATITPVVLANTGNLLAAGAGSVTIIGIGFDTTASNNTVTFNDGAVAGTITNATPTSLTLNLATKPFTAGPLTAVVTTDNVPSGAAVQVAKVTPVVTSSSANLAANATTLTIGGHGFDPVAGNNTLTFNDGVSGTVTAATPTSLIVSLTTTPATTTAGSLTAVVTTDGAASGAATQVATITPIVSASTADLNANAATLVINGYGFYGTTPSNNTVTFSGAAVGTVTAATPTSITVTFSTPPTAGALTATVNANGHSTASPVQVANVLPVVLADASYRPSATATTLLINGYGFDATASHDVVTLSDGAVVGSVTVTSPNLLTVTLSASPTSAGNLTAVVTTDGASSAAVQVATVTPVVTASTTNLAANATTLTIAGHGFDPTAGNNSVAFTDGTGTATGSVTAATPTLLTVTFGTLPTVAGPLTAVVTTDGAASGLPVQVVTVAPVVTGSTNSLAANAATITISGADFDATAAKNSVVFNDGAVGSVTSASTTLLTVTFSTMPAAVGSLTAAVTTDNVSSGAPVQVATVAPVVSPSTANLAANASTVTINGFDFDLTSANNTVVFNDGAVASSVTANSATSLTVTFSTKPTAGNLTAMVTTDGDASGTPVQVATVAPVVTSSSTNLAANATTLTIGGAGFDPAGVNTVSFNDGAVGTITAATATSLTVTLSTDPTTAGSLTAVVTTDGATSGAPVQVATVAPAVTSSTANLAANAATITINGFGFDPIASHNTVAFNDGAVGAVTAATANALTVKLLTDPAGVANLDATVTTDGVSGAQVQVASVAPIVLANSAYQLAANAGTIVINGFGFDPTASHNTVAFNDGAVGTVQSATATSLTVTFSTKPAIAGSLTAVVTSDGATSGTAVQVASVAPVVTGSTSTLAANTATITINGYGFNPTAAGNTVTFSGAAVGAVTAASTTSLTVTFTTPPTAGNLTVVVHTNGITSGTPVQVATVTPSVTLSTASLAANAGSITISGYGFDTTGTNTVTISNGAVVSGVTVNSATSLTVNFSTKPTAGNLTASVTTDGQSSGAAVQVASVVPVVTSSSAAMLANAATITINGFGFDSTAAHNSVAFSGGASGIVTTATATSLTVTFATVPTGGNLTAVVTTNGHSSSSTQVAAVTPVVTASSANLAINSATLTIHGYGFDSTPANNLVTLTDGTGSAAGTVTAASPTSITVTFSTKPTVVGNLTAVVTTDGASSGAAVRVATVAPVVTSTTSNTLANGASQVTINGFGFDSTAGNNSVTFNNGAAGTVTTASATSLTVTFSTKPAAGSLTAAVTSDTVSSGSPVQVANVAPVVTSSTTSLAATATTVTISGSGFDSTPANNTVVFNDGAAGAVIGASATSLTVTFTTNPATAGSLTAAVTTNGVSSGTPVQVATVTPVVTSSTASLALNGTSVVIKGYGFDPTAAHNTIAFNDGAVGTVTSATPTSITATFSTKPTATGNLTAIITTDSQSSGAAVQVAAVVSALGSPPAVTSSTTSILANAATVTIHGTNFSATPGNNTVVLSDGAVGAVTGATTTSLTVTLSTAPTAGNLTAVVTTEGMSSGAAVQVATVAPVVISSTANLAVNAATVTITGYGFDPASANNTVTFNGLAAGSVTAATPTSITVTFSGTSKLAAGSLTAAVTTDSVSSGAPVQVATVLPVVTSSTTSLAVNASSVVINGFGFSTTAASNTVTFNDGAVAGTITAATATSLTVNLATKPTGLGSLTATVGVAGATSAAAQVATVAPVVTSSTASLSPTATQLTINGFGFDTVPSMNAVTFNNGAVGVVTGATATSLTVSFTVAPSAGTLNAAVTTDGVTSGTPVEVAVVAPAVTQNNANLAANAGTVVINGFGFSTTPANNTVVFNGQAAGTVTAATATSLTVTFSGTSKLTAGSLTATVTTGGQSSGPVQVATVSPVITSSTANLSINATTLTISGFGFDPVAANNKITFNDGAVDGISAATANSLTVTFSTKPTAPGNLTASVTTDGVSSGAAVRVATVTPVVTSSNASLLASAASITIAGFGFDTVGTNSVTFSNGAVASAVSASSGNSVTFSFSTKPTAGVLTAIINSMGVSSGTAIQVATVNPVVTQNTGSLTIASTSQIVLNGFGFDPTAANNTVVFNDGGVGTVTSATKTSLTVQFTTGHKPTAGALTAVVTTDSVSSGVGVQVATMV